MATIATHNGSGVSRGHNLRKPDIVSKESHIDPNGIHETWYDVAPRQTYERLFGDAVREYNAKQTRNDRKISNYYNEVRDDQRRHVVYEMIIGIYPKEHEVISEKNMKDIMHKFVDTWHFRNPNLELTGVYYHADEQGSPHVHIDYIPVAHGYKRGPAIQNGLVKALGEMGLKGTAKNTAQIQWEARENAVLEQLCIDKGIQVEHPQMNKGVKHIHTKLYKANEDLQNAKTALSETKKHNFTLHQRNYALSANITDLQEEKTILKEDIVKLNSKKEHMQHSIQLLQRLETSKKNEYELLSEEIESLQKQYDLMLKNPPKEKVIEIPHYVDKVREIPVEVPVEVEKIVEVKKIVETSLDYKKCFNAALNAFKAQSEWIQNKGFAIQSYNDLSDNIDYLRANKTIYPLNRARVDPLVPNINNDNFIENMTKKH